MAKSKKAKKKKGVKLTKTGKYLMTPKKGKEREFTGTLLETFNLGNKRIAVFSIPKY